MYMKVHYHGRDQKLFFSLAVWPVKMAIVVQTGIFTFLPCWSDWESWVAVSCILWPATLWTAWRRETTMLSLLVHRIKIKCLGFKLRNWTICIWVLHYLTVNIFFKHNLYCTDLFIIEGLHTCTCKYNVQTVIHLTYCVHLLVLTSWNICTWPTWIPHMLLIMVHYLQPYHLVSHHCVLHVEVIPGAHPKNNSCVY